VCQSAWGLNIAVGLAPAHALGQAVVVLVYLFSCLWFLACARAGGSAGPTSLTALILYWQTVCLPIPTRAVRVHSLHTQNARSMWLGVARWQASHGGCGGAAPYAMLLGVVAMTALSLTKVDCFSRKAGLAAAVRPGAVVLWLPRRQLVCLQLLACGVQLSPHGSLVAALHWCMVASVWTQSSLGCWSCAGPGQGRDWCCGLSAPCVRGA
jgi:hypothetical protein